MAIRVLLLVGTRKGAFIAESDAERRTWTLRGPLCEGWPVHDLSVDPASGAIYAAAGSPWYGPAVWRSDDLGSTWTHSSAGLTYGDGGPAIPTVWNVTAAHGAVFAGVEPAGLFRSDDGGATWSHVAGLTEHPTRSAWEPGNGGLILHTIVPHAGRTRCGCGSASPPWGRSRRATAGRPGRRATRACAPTSCPARRPSSGSASTSSVAAAGEPETLYQQNHCGVYRSDDGGASWIEITGSLPSEFGFPMVGPPAGSLHGLGDPAQRSRPRPVRAGRRRRRLADEGPGRVLGAPRGRASAGARLPGRPARGDGRRSPRPGRRLVRHQQRRAVDERGRGIELAPGGGAPARHLVGRGPRRRRLTDPMATVVLPRSLVALFPGAERRTSAPGASVAEVIAALDGQIPGLADRVLAPGPAIREHLNIYVDGERATPRDARRTGLGRPRDPGRLRRVGGPGRPARPDCIASPARRGPVAQRSPRFSSPSLLSEIPRWWASSWRSVSSTPSVRAAGLR